LFKILIVDDEKIVIDAVTFIIEKEFKEVLNYSSAKSGREAIEKCESFNPDIVLMDIRMPGINGIEAINEIKKTHANTIFIIVSAYEQFEYAKEAIRLGVEDYILKPINKKNFVLAIENVIKKLVVRKEKSRKQLENIENYQNLIPIIEHSFIYSILLGEGYGGKVLKYKELLGITEVGGYIMILEYNPALELEGQEDYYKLIRDAFKYKCNCFIGPLMINRVVIFVSSNFKVMNYEKVEAVNIANSVVNRLKAFSNEVQLNIGIGSYKIVENIALSYEEALRAIHYYKDKEITYIKDIENKTETLTQYPKEQENRLIEMILNVDEEGALDAFNKIYIWILKNYKDSHKEGKWKLTELMMTIDKSALDFGIKDENKSYLFNMNSIDGYVAIESLCRERIVHTIKNAKELQKKKINRAIVNAKVFINENFSNEITLEEVSKEVCVSTHYFSRLFKEETSENFIEYLTRVRLDRAKELMKNSDLSIKEICFKVGFADPNYFSHTFKKTEKLTPSEYIKNCKKE